MTYMTAAGDLFTQNEEDLKKTLYISTFYSIIYSYGGVSNKS